MNVPGFTDVEREVESLRKRSNMYTVFNIPNLDPVTYKVIKNGGLDYKGELTINYQENILKEIFEECMEIVKANSPCYIIYDFVFYDKDLWKNTFCLISYIPDSLKIKEKVAYSTNALTLIKDMRIPLHISCTKKEELTFNEVKERCSKFRR
ncbi:putative ADF actin-binding protein [Vairimorpha necatrix]|uniref:ADF actin-binding protein n=1 Tax=Vairimorpha necatrix TaxID=6039 RepID=A0AAX4JED5_9MICR